MNKKENIIMIAAAFILLLVIFGILFILITQPSAPTNSSNLTPTVTETPPTYAPPPRDIEQKTEAPVIHDEQADLMLIERLEERKTLSAKDQEAKTKALKNLPSGQISGILYSSKNVIIDFTSSANIFQVEILTTNIDQAKTEGENWFRSQGFSQDAICNYPVQFYLNYEIAEELRGKNIIFSPLASSCQ